MNNYGIRSFSVFLVSLLVLGGCQSDITLSRAVRKGDTLVVSLGDANPNGEFSNINSTLIRESDIIAKLTDSSSQLYWVTVRHVFRVFGDPTAVKGEARGQAQWMAVIDLINPLTLAAQNLAVGAATIALTSDKFDQPQIVKTEILAGTG